LHSSRRVLYRLRPYPSMEKKDFSYDESPFFY